jgi:hypothetical protein
VKLSIETGLISGGTGEKLKGGQTNIRRFINLVIHTMFQTYNYYIVLNYTTTINK